METIAPKKAVSRKTSEVAITDFDAHIVEIFKKAHFRPSRELVVKIREKVLSNALQSIGPATVSPFIQEELAKIGCVPAATGASKA